MLSQALEKIHKLLAKAKIDHALIGGLALAAHRVERFTNDIDFLIDEKDIDKTLSILEGRSYQVFYRTENVLQLDGDIPIDILIARRPISRELLSSAKKLKPIGIKVVSVEGLIALKIQAYSNDRKREFQDKADIQALIEKNELDWNALKKMIAPFDEWAEVQRIRKIVKR